MKSEWKKVPIKDLCVGIYDGPHATPPKSDSGAIFLGIPNFSNGRLDLSNIRYISENDLPRWTKRVTPKAHDIVFSYEATLNLYAIIPEGFHGCLGRRMALMRPDETKVNYKFLYYYMFSSEWREEIERHKVIGSTVDRIPLVSFPSFIVNLPDVATQRFIADTLSALDEKIELNNKINDNLEQQAQAIYNSIFVDFASLNQNKAQNSELGLIPIGWNIKSLSEVTQNIRDRVKDNIYSVLSALNTGCLCPSEEYFTKQVFSKNIKNYIVVQEFDFAYNPSRINIGSIGMNDLGYTGCVSPVYVVVRPEKGYHYFLDLFIKSKRFKEEVKVRASGSVRQSLTYADFGQIKVVYPPLDVVSDFNNKYEQILQAIRHYKKEIDILQNIRDTLLPKLMSGEIDVEDVKI